MNDFILVNDKDLDGFVAEARELRATGLSCTFNYIEEFTDTVKPRPGGWGCARFTSGVLPPGRVFDAEDDEYRYSDELGGWTKNGELADSDDQRFLNGLYAYFKTLEGVPV